MFEMQHINRIIMNLFSFLIGLSRTNVKLCFLSHTQTQFTSLALNLAF